MRRLTFHLSYDRKPLENNTNQVYNNDILKNWIIANIYKVFSERVPISMPVATTLIFSCELTDQEGIKVLDYFEEILSLGVYYYISVTLFDEVNNNYNNELNENLQEDLDNIYENREEFRDYYSYVLNNLD